MEILGILAVCIGGVCTYYIRYKNGEQKEIKKTKADLILNEWDKKKR